MAKVPLWQQISSELRDRIDTGIYSEKFPTETEVAQEFSVSRGTVREALRPLRDSGLITSARGRRPRVRQLQDTSFYGPIYSLKEVIEQAGFHATNRVLYNDLRADAEAAEHLELPIGTPLYCLERIRQANTIPVAHEVIYLPPKYRQLLARANFETNALYAELYERTSVAVTHGRECSRAVLAGDTLASQLHCLPEDPLLQIDRVGYSGETPLEFRRTSFVGERFSSTRTFGEPQSAGGLLPKP